MYKTAVKIARLGKPVNLVGPPKRREVKHPHPNLVKRGNVVIEVDTSHSQLRKRNKKLHQQRMLRQTGYSKITSASTAFTSADPTPAPPNAPKSPFKWVYLVYSVC